MNSIELIGGIRLSVPEKKGFARDLSTLLSPFCFVAGIVNPHLRHSMKKNQSSEIIQRVFAFDYI